MEFSYKPGFENKLEKKIKRNQLKFIEKEKQLLNNLDEQVLTYRGLTKDGIINGRMVVPFFYYLKKNEDLIVKIIPPKKGNIHNRIHVVSKNYGVTGYRRIQYDNISETILEVLEAYLPHANHNDVLMIIDYLLDLSCKKKLLELEKTKPLYQAREVFTGFYNQKWFEFDISKLCFDMICELDIVKDILNRLEKLHLIVQGGRFLHLNLSFNKEENYLQLKKEAELLSKKEINCKAKKKINLKEEFIDLQMSILSDMYKFSLSRKHQLNDPKYVQNFRVSVTKKTNEFLKLL